MSVILDALHKARTDRRKNHSESNPNSVARVLEPVVAPPEAPLRPEKQRGGSGWMLALTILLIFVCVLVLAGGAFFLLYDQMRRLEPVATMQPVQASEVNSAATMPAVPAAALATPLPLSELPVQTPAPVIAPVEAPAAAVAVAPTAAAVNPADSFKLGSIVCEENDCIANLNGRSVRVGDRVRNYQVIAITPSDITLQGSAPTDVITLSHYD